jgi:adenosine deaminase
LCGLYGEPPEVLEALVRAGETRPGVVGIDLAGGPSSGHAYSMLSYRDAFRRAKDAGIGRTVHAGEGRPPAEIRVAIEELHAQRIGHGTTLLDDPSVLDLVRERGVTIEACLTSNLHTGAVRAVEDHRLPRWLQLGVCACINTDNTLLSETTAPVEHALAGRLPGMTRALLEKAIAHGHAAAFHRSRQ